MFFRAYLINYRLYRRGGLFTMMKKNWKIKIHKVCVLKCTFSVLKATNIYDKRLGHGSTDDEAMVFVSLDLKASSCFVVQDIGEAKETTKTCYQKYEFNQVNVDSAANIKLYIPEEVQSHGQKHSRLSGISGTFSLLLPKTLCLNAIYKFILCFTIRDIGVETHKWILAYLIDHHQEIWFRYILTIPKQWMKVIFGTLTDGTQVENVRQSLDWSKIDLQIQSFSC